MNPLMRPSPHPAVRIHYTIPGVKINAGRLWAMWGRGGVGGVAPTDCIWRIGVGLGTVVGAGPSARREEDVLLFFCCDSHHLGHCSGPLLPLGVSLYEPVNAGFAAPCSKDPLHHPWCEDQCGGGGGGGVPSIT